MTAPTSDLVERAHRRAAELMAIYAPIHDEACDCQDCRHQQACEQDAMDALYAARGSA